MQIKLCIIRKECPLMIWRLIALTGNELRQKFLEFFAGKAHLVLPSASLIPHNDPSLLLIGAGMAPFKPFFTGKMKPPKSRITTCQKCVRTGDIENVGRTARHHTFFEMLGNFSFGDYFKKEAIAWGWEFVTKELNIPAEKLWVTIHTSDDEAFQIWNEDIGLAPERIIRMEDNFWEIGPGPCGPCSEIYVDLGEQRGCGSPNCAVGCDCDRYLEIWNLVFTQYDRDEAGNYHPLEKKNIDTGAGLERLASVLQGKASNFETDLIFPIIQYTQQIAGVVFGQSPKTDISLKVIADHARSMTVMISDGILPSNEGRGYVLRRILRRAVRHARLLGIEKMFLAEIVDIVAQIFAQVYPDISEKSEYIKKVIQLEEKRFHETLVQGIDMLNEQIEKMKNNGLTILDGATAFKLYDTFGFPWELTSEILEEHEMSMDKEGFDQAMSLQRERARAARSEQEERIELPDLSGLAVHNLKCDEAVNNANIVLLFTNGDIVQEIHDGQEAAVIFDVTPFHPEGGGQVGDTGIISAPLGKMEVAATYKLPDGTVYQKGIVTEGMLRTGDSVTIALAQQRKMDITRNHTATHLLHAALRQVLGSHVNQAGSYVGPERLRFDFSHFAQVSETELLQIESIVNEIILENRPVEILEMTQEAAKQQGAMALFGEKYGEVVRVVSVQDYSKELCGGSHVASTAQIGTFKILSESGIGAGLRRIEAVSGRGVIELLHQQSIIINQAAATLKSRPEELQTKIDGLLGHNKELEHQISLLTAKIASAQVKELVHSIHEVKGVQVIAAVVTAADMDNLRSIADMLRDHMTCGVSVLGAVANDKVNLVAMASKEAVKRGIHAGNIVKQLASIVGGGGGGRPDMAQAGGKEPGKINEAMSVVDEIVAKQIKE